MPKLIDLTGNRYGRLTVIERTDNRVFPSGISHTVWKCRCDCGIFTSASTNDLRTGHKQSCGCRKYEYSHSKGRPWNRKHNSYTVFPDYVQGHSDTGDFIFDIADYDRVKSHYWRPSTKGYIITEIDNHQVSLHRYLLNPLPEMQIDHINHDKSDNRRNNLRVVSQNENQWNMGPTAQNTSGVKGVAWNKRNKKWVAFIYHRGNRYHLGTFDNKEDAISARHAAEEKYYGEYSYANSMAAVPQISFPIEQSGASDAMR